MHMKLAVCDSLERPFCPFDWTYVPGVTPIPSDLELSQLGAKNLLRHHPYYIRGPLLGRLPILKVFRGSVAGEQRNQEAAERAALGRVVQNKIQLLKCGSNESIAIDFLNNLVHHNVAEKWDLAAIGEEIEVDERRKRFRDFENWKASAVVEKPDEMREHFRVFESQLDTALATLFERVLLQCCFEVAREVRSDALVDREAFRFWSNFGDESLVIQFT